MSGDRISPEQVQALALADLGQKALNICAVPGVLGHANLRNSLRYLHPADPASELVCAIASGDAAYLKSAGDRWLEYVEGHKAAGTSPTTPA